MHVIGNLAKDEMRNRRICNFIRIEYPRNFEKESNRIEYEYSVASNMIRILKTERYRDVLPGHGVIPWPWLQRIDLLVF